MDSRKALDKTPQRGLEGHGHLCIYPAGDMHCPVDFVTESIEQAAFATHPRFWEKALGSWSPLSHSHSQLPPTPTPEGFPFHFLPAWEGKGQNSLLGQALKNHFLCGWGRASSCRVDLGVPKCWEQEEKPLEEPLLSREPSRQRTMEVVGGEFF